MPNRVKAERSLKGLTQEQLGDLVGADKSTIGRWENGGAIPQEKIVRLRNLFGCSVDWLLGLSEERLVVKGAGKGSN
ncbi:helix-turn-helix domain-containing protein [uncultured Slackia sp.]|uniref:helix-turn-helix domain-containing protein n=1 Tax=uncultured Slackia sp. TaxID=665903 RepID=UPI0025F3B1E8|nr:helix-turn-helix transcriptional regulator [uncultured Slackia sp.]